MYCISVVGLMVHWAILLLRHAIEILQPQTISTFQRNTIQPNHFVMRYDGLELKRNALAFLVLFSQKEFGAKKGNQKSNHKNDNL
ncbi:hypothetical protein [Flavobacterium sp. GCM10023249]|uniref:hypothetical protein n=1 Tax=unclassified Flavobacterium TaxID=196869 RepID=UPI00362351F9